MNRDAAISPMAADFFKTGQAVRAPFGGAGRELENWGRGAMQKKNAKPNQLHPYKVRGNIALSALLRRLQNNQQDLEAGEEIARRLDTMVRSASVSCCSLKEHDRRGVEQTVLIELSKRTLLADPKLRELLGNNAADNEVVKRVWNNIRRALKNRTVDAVRKKVRHRGEPLRADGELPGNRRLSVPKTRTAASALAMSDNQLVFYIISREEIASGDTSRFLAEFGMPAGQHRLPRYLGRESPRSCRCLLFALLRNQLFQRGEHQLSNLLSLPCRTGLQKPVQILGDSNVLEFWLRWLLLHVIIVYNDEFVVKINFEFLRYFSVLVGRCLLRRTKRKIWSASAAKKTHSLPSKRPVPNRSAPHLISHDSAWKVASQC